MTEKNVLTGFLFFSDVDPETLEAIAGKGEILEFKAEDVIFHVDEPATHFYGLLEGEVDLPRVRTHRHTHRPRIIRHMAYFYHQ